MYACLMSVAYKLILNDFHRFVVGKSAQIELESKTSVTTFFSHSKPWSHPCPRRFIFRTSPRGPLEHPKFKYPMKEEQ